MLYIGIDPGVNGGIAWTLDDGQQRKTEAVKMPTTTTQSGKKRVSLKDLSALLAELASLSKLKSCALEKVASRPGQGVASCFTFGRAYGNTEAAVVCHGIPLERVLPRKWQQPLGLITSKEVTKTKKKNQHKAKAQELWPDLKITHATADALLICEWWRRYHTQPPAAVPLGHYHTGPSMTPAQLRRRHKRIMEGE